MQMNWKVDGRPGEPLILVWLVLADVLQHLLWMYPITFPKPHCPGQKLDRHSTIKPNEEFAFNKEEGWWWVVDYTHLIKSVAHAGTQIHTETHLDTSKKTNKQMQQSKIVPPFSKCTHMRKHSQSERWRGQKSLDWRASNLKNESLAIHHASHLLSDIISLLCRVSQSRTDFNWFIKLVMVSL